MTPYERKIAHQLLEQIEFSILQSKNLRIDQIAHIRTEAPVDPLNIQSYLCAHGINCIGAKMDGAPDEGLREAPEMRHHLTIRYLAGLAKNPALTIISNQPNTRS